MPNQYPLWKYLLLAGMILLAFVYAIPNLFGDDYAVQISTKNTTAVEAAVSEQVETTLQKQSITYQSVETENGNVLVRFPSTDMQLKGRDVLKTVLGDEYSVALNLASKTPHWLQAIGANPMKLGLDLRGGVHFLLDVDTSAVMAARQEGDLNNFTAELREKKIRYTEVTHADNKINIQFRDKTNFDQALPLLQRRFTEYAFSKNTSALSISAALTPEALITIINYSVDQNMSILSKRVNELGVSDAIVQRQGKTQISVDLPGIQDTARAKDIIGKTATLRFQLVDVETDLQNAVAGAVPLGSHLYQFENMPLLLKNQVILAGASITYATATMGEEGPSVSIRLGGGGESLFKRVTAENVGKPLAVVYIESNPETRVVNGKSVVVRQQTERVINVAKIRAALGNNFEITHLSSMQYAQNLALLLRSGALTAPVDFIQERTVGPSLGAANIHKGILSIEVGSLAVILFMLFYYRFFGLVANLALIVNMVFIVSVLSLLGATLTLPGIAAIVLNVGMAVDANVLIYERIREELRNGVSPQASIHAGYERAFSTIMDSNITTLIVALILFALGGGVVKGFAITLIVGILTSMITAIFFTRALVNLVYGGRAVKRLSIGISVAGGK